MKEPVRYKTVEMVISSKVAPIAKQWHIKFERDVVMFIDHPRIRFSSESLNVAVTKVADLVARHPENYFEKIIIE